MKKFFVGALMVFTLFGFGTFTQAQQVDTENLCCGGYCYTNCDEASDNASGEYCGRYGCRR